MSVSVDAPEAILASSSRLSSMLSVFFIQTNVPYGYGPDKPENARRTGSDEGSRRFRRGARGERPWASDVVADEAG